MKNHMRFRGITGSPAFWLGGLSAVLVLFPFEWLSDIWPAYALVFDRVFATPLAHEVGHMTIFLLAGLLVLCSIAWLRRNPLLAMIVLILGALGEELLQALSKRQLPNVGAVHDIGFDALGFVVAYLLVWGWWRLRDVQKDERGKDDTSQGGKGSITRRTTLLGLAGAAGAVALGGGAAIWYVSTRRPQLLAYTGHHGAPITALCWSPDGNSIASGDANGTVLIWDAATGATVLTCREPAANSVASVSWSPDGTSILTGYSNMLVIWNTQSGENTLTTAHLTGPAAYSPVGDYKPCYLIYPSLIAACQNQQSVCVFPSTSLKTPITSFDVGSINTLAFDPADEALNLAVVTAPPSQKLVVYAAVPASTCAQNDHPNATLVYEMTNTPDLSISDAGELSIPWGPGGSYLLGGSLPRTVMIRGEWGSYEMAHPAEVVAAALCPAQASLPAGANPDGWYTIIGYVATADAEGIVRIWGNDGKYVIARQAHHPVLQLAWSPDGKFLATVHSDGTVQIWQAQLSSLPAIWRNTSFN